ncbi:MAG TPA: FAD-dependent oxidoreductase [Streptosporangiaceae bacterium]|nr:FAD-dependent oxidoreductase [Streptosporangiaceae bacterium]
MNTPEPVDIVVVGAGYAGVMAANRLLGSLSEAERSDVRVTVVNPRTEFVERIRLHQLAAGSRESVMVPLTGILHDGASLVVGSARMIDTDARTVTVTTAGGDVNLRYDYLIYALGSVAAASVPGAREHSCLLADAEGAQRAAAAIKDGRGQRVLVVGGGLTGVEAASEIAELHPDFAVTLVSQGPVLSLMRTAARNSILRKLRRLGVAVETGVAVGAIESDHALLADDRKIAFDVCVLAASFAVPDLARLSGLAVDQAGRLRVDEYLRAVNSPEIIGAGDSVVAPDSVARHLRMSCAAALPLGGHAANTVLAALRGETPKRLSVGFLIQCISLGRRAGYVQVVRADDAPRPFHLGGWLGARVKESICTMVVRALREERSKPGAYHAPRGPKAVA